MNRIKMIKFFKYVSYIFIGFFSCYLVSSLVLENVFIGEKKLKSNRTYIAYVSSADIHTEFIFPVSNELFNWTEIIPVNLVTNKIPEPKYISIGWGSRDFFFNMKTWDEINYPVVLKAIFLPGESTLHVEYLKDTGKGTEKFPLFLTKKEYLDLISYVKNFFILDSERKVQKISDFSYYETDKFFKSYGSYHMFNTCNMWTQKGLEKINALRPIWSPGKYGINKAMKE